MLDMNNMDSFENMLGMNNMDSLLNILVWKSNIIVISYIKLLMWEVVWLVDVFCILDVFSVRYKRDEVVFLVYFD